MYESHHSAFGHVCTGGGAEIKDSPVNVTLNITIHIGEDARVTDEQGRLTETGRTLSLLECILSGGGDRQLGNEPSIADLETRIDRFNRQR